jgi:hypothetical protein
MSANSFYYAAVTDVSQPTGRVKNTPIDLNQARLEREGFLSRSAYSPESCAFYLGVKFLLVPLLGLRGRGFRRSLRKFEKTSIGNRTGGLGTKLAPRAGARRLVFLARR